MRLVTFKTSLSPLPVMLYYWSLQGDTSVVTLIILYFGVNVCAVCTLCITATHPALSQQNAMIINIFAVLPSMQLRSSKRVSDFVFSSFIINYSFLKTSFKNQRMT